MTQVLRPRLTPRGRPAAEAHRISRGLIVIRWSCRCSRDSNQLQEHVRVAYPRQNYSLNMVNEWYEEGVGIEEVRDGRATAISDDHA